MSRPRLLAAAILSLLLLLPGSGDPLAGPARGAQRALQSFYDSASPTLATVEFSQEFVAGGQRQQTRAYTDGVVISEDGMVLISGRVRFPQRGSSGRLSGGSLPELSGFILHFSDGRRYSAEVLGFQDDMNLGLLRIVDAPDGTVHPHVQLQENFTAGVGTSLRTMTLYTQEFGRRPVLQPVFVNALLDTPSELWSLSGVSDNLLGAPLWGPRGRVVGVVAAVPMSAWGGRQVVPDLSGPVGLPFDRFAQWLQTLTTEARTVGEPEQVAEEDDAAWLGVMFQPLERELAAHMKISEGGGLIVSRVVAGSPADQAGIEPLDILVELQGERIAVLQQSDTHEFSRRVRSHAPGSRVQITRERPGGAQDTVEVTLAPTPTSELHAERTQNAPFELTVRELTLDTLLEQRLDPQTKGVVVDGVTRAGWAGLAGLNVGLIIQRINDHDVDDLASFTAALDSVASEQPDQVLFFVRHGRTTRFFVAEPDWTEDSDAP